MLAYSYRFLWFLLRDTNFQRMEYLYQLELWVHPNKAAYHKGGLKRYYVDL